MRNRRWWANVPDMEGANVSVGPFRDHNDAARFIALMFCAGTPDSFALPAVTSTGEKMTVRQFQDAFRADFMVSTPEHWRARN